MLFYTQSGSIYEINVAKEQIRKLSNGSSDCTEWFSYSDLELRLHVPALVTWDLPNGQALAIATSPVTRIVYDKDLS